MDSADETLRTPVAALGNQVGLGRTADVFVDGTDGSAAALASCSPRRPGKAGRSTLTMDRRVRRS